MMRPHAIVPREERTPQYLCASVLEELIEVFLFCSPESDRDLFMQNIYHPTRRENAGGDAMVKFWKDKNEGKLHLSHLIQISCAYCVQAANAMDKQDLAKSYLMDAHLYLGMARAGMTSNPQVADLRDFVAKEALAANARHSVSVSVDPWRKTKEEAMRLIRESAKAGCQWTTPSEAAKTVAEDVEKFLSTLEPRKRFQGRQQRDVKIGQWLREMPEAFELFTSLRKES